MMAASGRGIRGKGGREEAGARPPPESAGSKGAREAGDPPLAGAGGAPRCRGWIEKTAARGSAARRKGRGGLAGRRKARGREPAWRACASPGKGEEEERAGGSSRRGRGGEEGAAACHGGARGSSAVWGPWAESSAKKSHV
uniref:Uncharacterized protein n=1 Tax=Canis lupus familiaris TaxID=9615 RepID=A0A8C0R9C0_CANLF